MSHKIAKARRKADRGQATPHDMHTLLVDMERQRLRGNAHRLKAVSREVTHSRRTKAKRAAVVREGKDILLGRVSVDKRITLSPTGRHMYFDEYTDIFSKI